MQEHRFTAIRVGEVSLDDGPSVAIDHRVSLLVSTYHTRITSLHMRQRSENAMQLPIKGRHRG